jgi:Arc/MetJ family transcription regulator
MTCIYHYRILYIHKGRESAVAVTMTSIRLDIKLADEAVKVLGAKSRTDAVHIALREIVALKRFKALMKKNEGKLSFEGYVD